MPAKLAGPHILDCDTHGRSTWAGDIVCAACGVIFKGNEEGRPVCPTICHCGKRLMPADDVAVGFTGRMACRPCAAAVAFIRERPRA